MEGVGLPPPLFRMEGVSKRYGGVRALEKAELSVRAGHIHAVRVPGGRPRRFSPGVRSDYFDDLLEPAVDSRGRAALAWRRGDTAFVARLR